MPIETFWPNIWLFELLKAGNPPRHLAVAEALAAWPIWLVPLLLLAVWFRGGAVYARRRGPADQISGDVMDRLSIAPNGDRSDGTDGRRGCERITDRIHPRTRRRCRRCHSRQSLPMN